MNSLRMSFWMVPSSWACLTPCSSAATMNMASTGSTAPFMVIETDISVERDAVEEDLHVLDGVDGDAGLADIAGDARMVAVIAAMGGEIEGDGEALLAGGEGLAVEIVAFARGGEAGILPDGPGAVGIHGGADAAGEGRDAGECRDRW